MTGELLCRGQRHAEVREGGDERPPRRVHRDALSAADVRLVHQVHDATVYGRVALVAAEVADVCVLLQDAHCVAEEYDRQRNLHEGARLLRLHLQPRDAVGLPQVVLGQPAQVAPPQARIATETEHVADMSLKGRLEAHQFQFLHFGEHQHVVARPYFGYLVEAERILVRSQQVALDRLIEQCPQDFHAAPHSRVLHTLGQQVFLEFLQPRDVDVLQTDHRMEEVDLLHRVVVALLGGLAAVGAVLHHVVVEVRQRRVSSNLLGVV